MAKSKHSQKFKLEVVKYYINEHMGYKNTANKFNISETVKRWVKKYEEKWNNLLKLCYFNFIISSSDNSVISAID